MEQVIKNKTKILVETQKVVDKKMPVFYNPVMVLNRDFSLLVLSALGKKKLCVADPLAGSGIRSIRMLNELDSELINKLLVNDIKPSFKEIFNKNLELNNVIFDDLIVSSCDANLALLNNGSFDFVEIDPFGSPNSFLDSAIKSLKRDGILSVTATDTSALCGSYTKACFRKYWAEPLRNELMHEFGARILIRKVQLLGAQHSKALIPLVTIATDHYVKVFFLSKNSKSECDNILKKHEFYEFKGAMKGPIWTGTINDEFFISKMRAESEKISLAKKTKKLLSILIDESKVDVPFFFDIHEMASDLKANSLPKLDDLINSLINKGFLASRTHFNDNAIKTNATHEVIVSAFKELIKN